MFGFLRREKPQLQLYGKLGIAKDYLRLGLSEGAGLGLRDWLDAAYSTGTSGGPGGDTNSERVIAWPARFVIGDAWGSGGAPLQGVAWPSADAGGHRPFPFVMAVERRRRTLLEELQSDHGDLAQAERVWQALWERCRSGVAKPDGQAALRHWRGEVLELGDLPAGGSRTADSSGGRGVPLVPWLESLWPEAGREGFRADLQRLAALRAGEGAGHTRLRLPLSARFGFRPQVQAWVAALRQLGLLEDDVCPTLFFPQPLGLPELSALPQPVLTTPPFLAIFLKAASVTDREWIAGARAEPLSRGDLVGGRSPQALLDPTTDHSVITPDGTPPLVDSLRGILVQEAGREPTSGPSAGDGD